MSHDDYAKEPLPGLPEKLPEGENILWQGQPDQGCFRRSVLHTRKIGFYFALVVAWNVGTTIYDGGSAAAVLTAAVGTTLMAAVVYGLAYWFARAVERTTVYTITNKRVVMRFGIAIPITFNFPFTQIESADIRSLGDGNGIIALSLKEHTKISWVIMWPHARPWKLAKPQPALRGIADVGIAAKFLADGLRATHGKEAITDTTAHTQPQPVRHDPINTPSFANT